jgi:dTDP-4-amino-4,6-dideoxygalactose transaminase
MSTKFIPFHRPSIGREEMEAVRQVLESGWLTTGPVAQRFEQAFADFIGAKYALAVNSCTAALHLALDAAGVRAGDEVLLPSYTFTATAEVVTYMGARPVLCESLPGGFNIDPADAERRVTEKTKAIIPVHIAGLSCDLPGLQRLADRFGLHLIEDAAHALPATCRGRRIGSISEFTAFSFYATKTITTAEGGMLTTNCEEHARRAAMMRLHGIAGDAWKRYSAEGSWYYEVEQAGYKTNMPDLLAALGVAQLSKAEYFHRLRCEIANRYLNAFAKVPELQLPPLAEHHDSHSWHLFILRLVPGAVNIGRNEFIAELKSRGIGASVHFIPLHLHPFYQQRYDYARGDMPEAEDAYSRCFSLPIFPDMTNEEIERVIATVEVICEHHRTRVYAGAA